MKTNMITIPPQKKREQTYPIPWFHAIKKSDVEIFNVDNDSRNIIPVVL
uniref:Uncharacterized protein n=1 Tax=Arundo donax TaxID=35708 RepID=A0A0A9APP0_ARUDO